ncbi:hypothetical protein VQ02_13660 [Methylobacterium variabile]|jgi:uncharacterized membrane protein YoaK (UPF0700 family)|uniref:DUF1275 domain-containing protein n=1 Tax=Methylobacterium variabile TaxID=298794 RepID=A0A0J6SUV5_9HYPH|nr:YoaK family protein [Methylobacterium variabile]KMO37327.1 hypothetical protein VQ02_13660 [Methylobacterium variabile]
MRDTHPFDIAGGLLLTAAAGYVDAVGFLRLDGLYTSFMSGNSTQFAVSLAQPGHAVAWQIGLLFVAFLAGGFCGSLVSLLLPGRWGSAAVLGLEAGLLVAALSASASPFQGPVSPLLAAAMGAQNAALRRSAGFRPGVTFVTGTLFSLSHTLAQAVTRAGPAFGWVPDACTWLALVGGAVVGGLAYLGYGLAALLVPAAGVGLVLALAVGRAVRVGTAA